MILNMKEEQPPKNNPLASVKVPKPIPTNLTESEEDKNKGGMLNEQGQKA